MNFGQNFLTWFQSNASPLYIAALIAFGIWIIVKREFSKIPVLLVTALLGTMLMFNGEGVKTFLINIGNALIQ